MKIYLIAFINLFFAFISYSQSNWDSFYNYPLKDAMSKVKDPFKKDNLKNNYASLLKTSITKGVDIDGKTPNVTLRILQSKLAVPNKDATELQQKTNPNYDLKVLLSDFSLIMGPYDKNSVTSYFGEFNDGDLPISDRYIANYIPMVFEFLIDDKHRGTFYTMANSYSQFQSNVDISEVSGSDGKLFLYKMKHIDLTRFFYSKTEYYQTDDDENPSTSYQEENYLKWMNFLQNLKSGNNLYIRFIGFADIGIYDEEIEKCGPLSSNWDLYIMCRKRVHGKFKFQPADYKSSTYEFSLKGSSNALSF